MGHTPPPPMPTNAQEAQAWLGPGLERELRGRRSRLAYRRRRAYAACLTLIRIREALLGMIPDPWLVRPPLPSKVKTQVVQLDLYDVPLYDATDQ